MKRVSLILLIVFAGSTGLLAQSLYNIHHAAEFFNAFKEENKGTRKQLSEKDIAGSPYLNDEFVEGIIYTYQKDQYNNVPIRYNIYNDELEFQTGDEQVMALAAPEIVEKADFGDYTLTYIPYMFGKKMKRGFFKILEEGPVSLYTRFGIDFQNPKEPGAYKEPEPARFVKKPNDYYIKTGQEAAVKIDNKKTLIDCFPDHKEEVDAFIKKDKTKLGKPDKLIALVKYYNSL